MAYRFVLVVLELGLGEVAIRARVSDLAIVALVLGCTTADAQRAANKALRFRVEAAVSKFACDDVLLNVREAVGRVLVLRLWDAAFVTWDAKEVRLELGLRGDIMAYVDGSRTLLNSLSCFLIPMVRVRLTE